MPLTAIGGSNCSNERESPPTLTVARTKCMRKICSHANFINLTHHHYAAIPIIRYALKIYYAVYYR